jgi:glycosyltransferase involved in cell wall biosynthesis
MKRILIFSTAYHPFIGGAEIAVKEITDRWSDVSFDLITLNLDGKQLPTEKIGNVTVYRIGGSGTLYKLFFPFIASRMARIMHAKQSYDAIWSIMASFSGFAALFFKKKFPKVPFVLTLQEGDPISYIKRQVWFVYPWFKQIFKRADHIQTISHYLADFAQDMGATSPITVIPNGVDLATFKDVHAKVSFDARKNMRINLGCNDNDVLLLTTSRLVEKNGITDVIGALTLLPEHIKFLIVGIGELEITLKNKVKKLALENRVKFIGYIDYAHVPLYLAAADIFIRPSLSEGMGNSFIEAMAAGLPVIATPVGGIPDFLIDRQTGLFCEPRNPTSIANRVESLVHDKELVHHITANARELALAYYGWDFVTKRIKNEIFAKVLV